MKLQNITTSWFVGALLLLISIWAAIFYYAMLDEIYDSIDDGLDNQKQLIIQKAASDSTVFANIDFNEGGWAVNEINEVAGSIFTDKYIDTSMYMQNEDDYEPVRMLTTVFRDDDKYYKLRIATSMVEEDDLVAELLYSLLWLSVGLILSILILNKILLGRIWKPFYSLTDQLKKYKLDSKEEIKFRQTRINEFRVLNESIKQMVERSKDTYNSQKQFIENASHELQTPLAISINKLETLAERNNLSKEDFKLLESTLENLERMKRLNRSLLLLTRIENKQYIEAQEILLNDVLKKLVEDFSDQSEFRGIKISIAEYEQCVIKINPDLANIMLSNLVRNGIIHNTAGGSLDIKIYADYISFENSGESPLNADKIFTRFYKEQTSSSSSGLGLAILKAITDAHGFNITYEFNGRHIFRLNFSK